jgi:hypothetical protein
MPAYCKWILCLSAALGFLACKKGPVSESDQEPVFVSCTVNGNPSDFRMPACSLIWSELNTAWGFKCRKSPYDAFSISFPFSLASGQYQLNPAKDPVAEMIYTDSSENTYQFGRGQLMLSVSDSAHYRYTGSFTGVFYNTKGADSLLIVDGSFHFHKLL